MGDKNPKAISKQKSQKQSKAAKDRQKREAIVARQSPDKTDKR